MKYIQLLFLRIQEIEDTLIAGGGGGGWYGGATRGFNLTGTYSYMSNGIAQNSQGGSINNWITKDGVRMTGVNVCSYAGTSHIQSGYSYNGKTYNFTNTSINQISHTGNGYASIQFLSVKSDSDFSATLDISDKAAPNIPVVKPQYSGSSISFKIDDTKDNGTTYQYKLQTLDSTNNVYSEKYTEEYNSISGLKGYYYYIDTNKTGNVTVSNSNFTENKEIITSNPQVVQYLHIAAIDHAGNLSGTNIIEIKPFSNYKVYHQKEELNGSYKTVDTENFNEEIGKQVTPSVKTYTGFTSPATQTITVKSDGTSEVIYKYTRNSYRVTLKKGTGISSTSGAGTYKYEQSVTIDAAWMISTVTLR